MRGTEGYKTSEICTFLCSVNIRTYIQQPWQIYLGTYVGLFEKRKITCDSQSVIVNVDYCNANVDTIHKFHNVVQCGLKYHITAITERLGHLAWVD